MQVVPEMRRVIQRFVPYSAEIRLHSPEECTVENLVDQLKGLREIDHDLITPENFNAALEETQMREASSLRTPSMQKQNSIPRMQKQTSIPLPMQKQDSVPRIKERSLLTQKAEPEPEESRGMETMAPKQRKPLQLYRPGDMVEVYSTRLQRWIEDGEVSEVVEEGCTRDCFQLRAGSMKILYDKRKRFKWVAPQQAQEQLRPSLRPTPPEPMVGKVLKETFADEGDSEWRVRHVELNLGYLQWWEAEDAARAGKASEGSMYLLGMQMQDEDLFLILRSTSTRGTVYTFQLEAEGELDAWTWGLWEHAGYCEEVRDASEAKKRGSHTPRMDEEGPVMGRAVSVGSSRSARSNRSARSGKSSMRAATGESPRPSDVSRLRSSACAHPVHSSDMSQQPSDSSTSRPRTRTGGSPRPGPRLRPTPSDRAG